MTVEEFIQALECARCEADCARLLTIELPQMDCTDEQRDDLAGKAMAKRFHFALTADGAPPIAAEQFSMAE